MKKLAVYLAVVLAIVVGAVSFAQAEAEKVNLYGERGQVDLFATELQSNGVASSNIVLNYGEPAMGRYNGKKWPGVRYQLGSDSTEDGWVPVSDARVKDGVLCRLQKEQAKQVAKVLRSGGPAPQGFVPPSPTGEDGAICSGDECWPFHPEDGVTVKLRCPLVFEGREVRTFIIPVKKGRPVNSIGAKIEWHHQSKYHYKTGWQPAVAFYNVTESPDALMTPQKRAEILAHFNSLPQKNDSEGAEGDACYDLVFNENGSVLYKN